VPTTDAVIDSALAKARNRLTLATVSSLVGRATGSPIIASLWGDGLGSASGAGGYDASRYSRTRSRSGRTGSGDFWVSRRTRESLRDYSRQVAMNNPEYRRVLSAFVSLALGDGMRPQARTSDAQWNRRAEALYQQWASGRVEATGELSAGILQRQLLYEALEAGDVGVQLTEEGYLLVVESELIGDPSKPQREERRNEDGEVVGTLFDGVEVDAVGFPIAYHVGRYADDGGTVRFDRPLRIPASSFALLRLPGRFSTTRGVIPFAHLLDRVEDLAEYIAWSLIAAKVSATLVAAVTTNNPTDLWRDVQEATVNAETGSSDGSGVDLFAVYGSDRSNLGVTDQRPGGVWYLRPGESVNTIASNQPNSIFEPFTKAVMRSLAYGANLPYGVVSLDFSGANLTTMKAELLFAERETEAAREVMRRFLARVWRWLVVRWVRDGRLAYRADMFAHSWNHAGIGWLDPVREVQADALASDKLLETHRDSLGRRGIADLEAHYAQLAYEKQLRQRFGLTIAHAPGTPLERAEPASDGEGNPREPAFEGTRERGTGGG
jgi:lambda family phage portal protein